MQGNKLLALPLRVQGTKMANNVIKTIMFALLLFFPTE